MNEEYKNYYLLLNAIMNSDFEIEPKNKNGVIVLYDNFNKDLPVGVFKSASSCAKFLGTSRSIVITSICRHYNIRKRYSIKRVKIDKRRKRG